MTLGNSFLDMKLSRLQHVFPAYFLSDPEYLWTARRVLKLTTCVVSPWPEGNASLLLHFVPFPFFHQSCLLWLCFLWCRKLHALPGPMFISQSPLLDTGLWGLKQNLCSLCPPLCMGAIPHLGPADTLLDRDYIARFSAGLVLGEVDTPTLQFTVILAQEISGSTHASSAPAVPCNSTP